MKHFFFSLCFLSPCHPCNCFIIMIDFYFYWARIGLKVMAFCFPNTFFLQIVFFKGMKIDIWNIRDLIMFKDNCYQWYHLSDFFILKFFIFETVIESNCTVIYKIILIVFIRLWNWYYEKWIFLTTFRHVS